MGKNKLAQRQIKFAGVICLLFVILAYPRGVEARRAHQDNVNTPKYLAQKFPDEGEPRGRRRGGTSRREGCPELKTSLTALVPGDKYNNDSFFGATVAEYPTFWVYVPELPKNVRAAEFVLQDKEGKDIYRTSITLTGQGVMGVSLPSQPQYALKQNTNYHWFFRVFCGEPQNKSEYFFVDAWLQRLALNPKLQQQLNVAKSKQYSVFADHNLWYDAVTNLVELRRSNPDDRTLVQDWTNLLKSVGLVELAAAPLTESNISQK
ncbi:DUF928 domain-containing protein [Iningainema tapete]|uniref:DUF928 domain-containing protein n=1 Tax=Iningainema tapete BLCC-T55 TaxID=2748662 RepID=A0A8J6XXC8_9CYAN|nr:DUF928 domain-containing protein [Iningainema tapete]MBD2778132.1 DUF928 domain-containing protein [Iningainema tapete BLCC-T55]